MYMSETSVVQSIFARYHNPEKSPTSGLNHRSLLDRDAVQ